MLAQEVTGDPNTSRSGESASRENLMGSGQKITDKKKIWPLLNESKGLYDKSLRAVPRRPAG